MGPVASDEFYGHSVEDALAQATGRAPVLNVKQSAICQRLLNEAESILRRRDQLDAQVADIHRDIQALRDDRAFQVAKLITDVVAVTSVWGRRDILVRLAAGGGDVLRVGVAVAVVHSVISILQGFRGNAAATRRVIGKLNRLRRDIELVEREIQTVRGALRRNNCRVGGR